MYLRKSERNGWNFFSKINKWIIINFRLPGYLHFSSACWENLPTGGNGSRSLRVCRVRWKEPGTSMFFSIHPILHFFRSFPSAVIPEVLTKVRTIRDQNGTHGDPCSRTRFPHQPDWDDEIREGESHIL